MAIRQTVKINENGAAITTVTPDATGDNYPDNTGRTFLILGNTHATDLTTFTIDSSSTAQFNVPGKGLVTKGNLLIVVNSGEQVIAGPFPAAGFNTDNGLEWRANGGTPLAAPFDI